MSKPKRPMAPTRSTIKANAMIAVMKKQAPQQKSKGPKR